MIRVSITWQVWRHRRQRPKLADFPCLQIQNYTWPYKVGKIRIMEEPLMRRILVRDMMRGWDFEDHFDTQTVQTYEQLHA